MSSRSFSLLEFEKMKSCENRVEFANAGMRKWKFWQRFLVLLLEKTVFRIFGLRESLQNTISDESSQNLSNAHLPFSWIACLYWQYNLSVRLFKETALFKSWRVCIIRFLSRLRNQYRMVTLHIAALRFYNRKSLIGKN